MKICSRQIKGLLATIAALSFGSSVACTCLYMGAFEEFAQSYRVVVRGTVLGYGEQLPNKSDYFKTMSVSVSESIKGEFAHSEIEFFGDTGMSCLQYITSEDYPIGSEHLFILESEGPVQPLLVCGESSVRIVGDSVEGQILDSGVYSPYSKNLDEFLELVR